MKEDSLINVFGRKNYSKGYKYYIAGRVLCAFKRGDMLIGSVQGRMAEPYTVKVVIRGGKIVEARCTCPVQRYCKHCVALVLTWINIPELFVDFDGIINELSRLTKEELIATLLNQALNNPSFADELFDIVTKKNVNVEVKNVINAIRKIRRAKFLNTYILRKYTAIFRSLYENGRYLDAVKVGVELLLLCCEYRSIGAFACQYNVFEDDETTLDFLQPHVEVLFNCFEAIDSPDEKKEAIRYIARLAVLQGEFLAGDPADLMPSLSSEELEMLREILPEIEADIKADVEEIILAGNAGNGRAIFHMYRSILIKLVEDLEDLAMSE